MQNMSDVITAQVELTISVRQLPGISIRVLVGTDCTPDPCDMMCKVVKVVHRNWSNGHCKWNQSDTGVSVLLLLLLLLLLQY